MSTKTSPRKLTARRRASIVASLREQRVHRDLGITDDTRFDEAFAKTADLFVTSGSPMTPAEARLIGTF